MKQFAGKKACIVFDLEWNQGRDGKDISNDQLPFEIIEIGAAKMNLSTQICGEYSQLIQPQVYKEMNFITKKLVSIEMRELRNGKQFKDALCEFKEWCGKDYIFATWGPVDITQLQKNMQFYKIPPFSKKPLPYYDVQKLFSLQFEDGKSRRTLEYATDLLNIEKDIPFHRAYSDAYYTAKVMQKITNLDVLEHLSYDTYSTPKTKRDEIRITFSDYYKYISKEYPDKKAAFQNKEIMETRCYVCGKKAKKKIGWFFTNVKHCYCIACCEKHGYIKGKIRLRKAENGNLYVIKTMKLVTREEAENVQEKLEKVREQRKNSNCKQKGHI